MMNRNKIAALALLPVFMLCSVSSFGFAPFKKKPAKTEAEAKKDPTTYEKLFKDKQVKTVKGFLTLHMVDSKLIVEMPKNLVGRDMLIGSTIEQTSDPEWGFAGMTPEKPLHIRITATDSLILVHCVSPSIIPVDQPQVQSAIDKSGIDPIMMAFPIECNSPDSTAYVFDATDLFVGDNEHLQPRDRAGSGSFGGLVQLKLNYVSDKSMLADVASYGDNVAISSLLTYSYQSFIPGFGAAEGNETDVITARAKRSLLLLPEQTARPRLADMRVGTVNSRFTVLAPGEQGSRHVYYANRWNLAPADANAAKGAPAKQITFYIDPMFPEYMRPYVVRGVEKWNDAFAQAGYANAIRVLPYPTDDKDFDPDNIRYSCIRYAPSTDSQVRANVWSDPRSGEIISATIYVPFNAAEDIYTNMLIYLGATVPAIRERDYRQELILQGLEALVTKAAARCLGLAKNYAGSYAFPTDSLRSAKFTAKYGISASITDELPYNFVARKADVDNGAALMQSGPGVYDQFVIKWLYTDIAGAETPEQEVDALAKMVKSKEGDPYYLYCRQQTQMSLDPRTRNNDLGRDAIKTFKAFKENISYNIANYDKWVNPQDKDYTFRLPLNGNTLMSTIEQFFNLIVNVGGIYINDKYEGDPQPSYLPVPKKLQQECMRFILDEGKDLSWLDNKEFTKDLFFVVSSGDYIQSVLMEDPYRRIPYIALSASKSDDPYTVEDAFDDLFESVTKDVRAGKESAISKAALNKQFLMLSFLAYYGNVIDPPKKLTDDNMAALASAVRSGHINAAHMPLLDEIYASGKGFEPMRGIDFNTDSNTDNLLYGYFMNLKKLYEGAIARTSNKQLIDQYKYMLLIINKALKID